MEKEKIITQETSTRNVLMFNMIQVVQNGEVYQPNLNKEGVKTPAVINEESEWPEKNREVEAKRPTSSGLNQVGGKMEHLQDDRRLWVGSEEGKERKER